jgi:disulfide oxidoreductase YuzD
MTPDEQLDTIYDKYQLESEAESVDWPKFKDALIFWRNLAVQELVYDKRVADNCRHIANADIAGTWLDPMTNKKLYNQAAVDAAVQQYVAELIGEDDEYYQPFLVASTKITIEANQHAAKITQIARNKLRATLRQKAALNPQGGTK